MAVPAPVVLVLGALGFRSAGIASSDDALKTCLMMRESGDFNVNNSANYYKRAGWARRVPSPEERAGLGALVR